MPRSRPGVRTGARIETWYRAALPTRSLVAPVFAPGRGLKLTDSGLGQAGEDVAPVFAPGRGLKQASYYWRLWGRVSPRCSHRGAD